MSNSHTSTADPQPWAPPARLAEPEHSHLLVKLADDPWSLDHDERVALRNTMHRTQSIWIERIADLVEPPPIEASFPAFLLGTTRFAHLAREIGDARYRRELATGTADELQRFVDRYREYLTEARS